MCFSRECMTRPDIDNQNMDFLMKATREVLGILVVT